MLRGIQMTSRIHHSFVIIGVTILIINMSLTSFTMGISAETLRFPTNRFDGNILFSPMSSTTTYLINNEGTIFHTWQNGNEPGYSVYQLGNGDILRAAKHNSKLGGMVQEISWEGEIIWEFIYDSSEHLSHHDIEPLPNGNVLMIAWEYKTYAETLAAGRNPYIPPNVALTPDHVIEVEPTGPTSGTIVWEWHVWDHLIQDYDPLKDNYGIVANHPELIDINNHDQHSIQISDWTHMNSIDYNEDLDQILLSSWYFNEIWVIDHSTTTQEAAGHSGGNSGRGGDLLYRWGNPKTYHAGTSADQQLFGQHDPEWISEGCPGAGNILIFNNGLDRPAGKYSSVEEIILPVNQDGTYQYIPGSPYLPESPLWTYTADVPTTFYSSLISGCQRLQNGNTLICDGLNGVFFEVTPDKESIWNYLNPFPSVNQNQVFKICYIQDPQNLIPDLEGEGALSWSHIPPGSTQTGTFMVRNVGDPESLLDWEIVDYPDWGTWMFSPSLGNDIQPEDGSLTVTVTVVTPDIRNTDFMGKIKIINTENSNDFCTIDVSLATPVNQYIQNWWFFPFLENHPQAFSILRYLIRCITNF